MATKSVYKDIRIKDKSLCRNFISALENAKGKKSKEVVMSKKVQTISGDKIKEIFLKRFKPYQVIKSRRYLSRMRRQRKVNKFLFRKWVCQFW